jgi:hypothetical protein
VQGSHEILSLVWPLVEGNHVPAVEVTALVIVVWLVLQIALDDLPGWNYSAKVLVLRSPYHLNPSQDHQSSLKPLAAEEQLAVEQLAEEQLAVEQLAVARVPTFLGDTALATLLASKLASEADSLKLASLNPKVGLGSQLFVDCPSFPCRPKHCLVSGW